MMKIFKKWLGLISSFSIASASHSSDLLCANSYKKVGDLGIGS